MKKTYHGSCHCGAVAYEADIDLSGGTFKCNCSICRKKRSWLVVATPADFRLISGEGALSEYLFGANAVHHLFCGTCGVSSFAHSDNPALGGKFYAVCVACLDDATEEELAEAPVMYFDGRNDRYDRGPDETRYL
ncbi:MAG: GFA family protein [Rhizobiaceae bacterium]|nr:GFA family protein [Rhizobiaceae bacterium]